jgi:flagellar hook-basal body complex protein FliE
MAIEPITPSIGRATAIGKKPSAIAETSEAGGSSFADSLAGLLKSVDETAGNANDAVSNMLTGKGDVHEAMIALQRAETTLQLTVQVRNKLVQAYQDVMRMPI